MASQSQSSSHRYTQDDSGYILVARMDSARNLSSILKAVQIKEVKALLPTCTSYSMYSECSCQTAEPAVYFTDYYSWSNDR